MNHFAVILIKLVTAVIAFAIGIALFFPGTMIEVLSFAVFVTIVSYIVGDRILLPRLGNMATTTIDFLLVYMSVWVFGNILLDNYMQIAWGSAISAIVISAVEVFIHRYLLSAIRERSRGKRRTPFRNGFAYEFGDDYDGGHDQQ